MSHSVQTAVMCAVLALSAGCADRRQPQMEGIKIGDLAPAGRSVNSQVLRATNIDVVMFELPVDSIGSLEAIREMLTGDVIRYNDANAFAANELYAGVGQYNVLDKVSRMLESARGKKLSTTSLLVPNGQAELHPIARLTRKATISYIRRAGAVERAQVEPGILGLQITARQVAGLSGVSNVQALPVISPSTEGLAPSLAARLKAGELRLSAAGFSLFMRAGEFVLLGPREYTTDESTAACQFFTKLGANPTVRVLLLVCTSVT